MLSAIRHLRLARWFAFLAIMMAAGVGPHVHAAKADAALVVAVHVGIQDQDHSTAPEGMHCGFCHFARGVLPSLASVGTPRVVEHRVQVIPRTQVM